ncbi:MAG: hypothetical protein KA715_13995 [Xanthomonadaceae bacterium]|nr:hypothetical protein [Xanthomonadaceae bacterium]
MSKHKYILGLWDGHDAGAALIAGDQILCCINEERITRKKLDVGFPVQSILTILKTQGIKPEEITDVAFTTSDFSKTLTRMIPSLKDSYYQIRRRKVMPGVFYQIKKSAKYLLTLFPSNAFFRWMSREYIKKELKSLGFKSPMIHLVGHHDAHAVCAAYCSGMNDALVITLDGIGDGLSGSAWKLESGKLTPYKSISGRDSFGIFFEHVTNLMNMRELEDEGKVMALANYAFPIEDSKNPMLSLFKIDSSGVHCKYGPLKLYKELKTIQWKYPFEQFAYMAQRVLEVKVLEFIQSLLKETGATRIAYAGGVASNIKINRLIRELPGVSELFVFPHMGDGGQALGAAMAVNEKQNGINKYSLKDLYLGNGYTDSEIETEVKRTGLKYKRIENPVETAAQLISDGEIIFWFQGRMEYGPRSLGARSILSRPDSVEIKDRLNLSLKRRVWYQPFCPSMLEADAKIVIKNYDGDINPFMTRAYLVNREHQDKLQGVIGIDGTCRPQILRGNEGTPYANLIQKVKDKTGLGVVLNTSFNIHGEPLVCSPYDALKALKETGVKHLVMGNYYIEQ